VTPPPAPAVTRAPTNPPPAPRVSAPPPPVAAQEPVARPTTPAPAPSTPVAAAPAPEPAATADADTGASGTTAQAEEATIRRSFEQNLNGGRRITRSLTQTQLEAGDVVYTRGPVKAILRRDSLRNDVFWLDGDLELMRVELKELTSNRYQVMERIRSSDNVRLRAVRSEEKAEFEANDPARHADERKTMERRYNGGNTITAKLTPTELRQKDVVYIGDDLVVVVRVAGLDLTRYWLIGKVNLGRTELIKDGTNKYKVLQDLH
jgi:hypothetical protein